MNNYLKFGGVVAEIVEFNKRGNPVILTDDTSGMVYNKDRVRCELHDSVSWEYASQDEYNKYVLKNKSL